MKDMPEYKEQRSQEFVQLQLYGSVDGMLRAPHIPKGDLGVQQPLSCSLVELGHSQLGLQHWVAVALVLHFCFVLILQL